MTDLDKQQKIIDKFVDDHKKRGFSGIFDLVPAKAKRWMGIVISAGCVGTGAYLGWMGLAMLIGTLSGRDQSGIFLTILFWGGSIGLLMVAAFLLVAPLFWVKTYKYELWPLVKYVLGVLGVFLVMALAWYLSLAVFFMIEFDVFGPSLREGRDYFMRDGERVYIIGGPDSRF